MTNSAEALRRLCGSLEIRRLVKPALVVILAFVLGASLLGLAGWFIAASAVAGLAVSSTFSFLFPSAGVQAFAWSRTLARYGERVHTHEVTLDLVGSLRSHLFGKALGLPRKRVAQLRSSELLGRIMVDSDAVENLFLRTVFPLVAFAMALFGVVVFLLFVSPLLAALTAGGMLISGGALALLASRHAEQPAEDLVHARATARRDLIETIEGLAELRSFGLEQRACDEAQRELEAVAMARRRVSLLNARGTSSGVLLADLCLLVVIAVAAGVAGGRELAAPAFVAVALVTIAVFEPVIAIPGVVSARAQARAAAMRLAEFFERSPEDSLSTPMVHDEAGRFTIEIGSDGSVLPVESGDTILLTGPSGSGKSSLLAAIAGRQIPGLRVTVGDIDVSEIGETALVSLVTWVAQDAHVFDGTIRENLVIANPDAEEAELWRALSAAALGETVATFPRGLDTPVGPGGEALSGGQRRRLSVAQGLLRGTQLLLLDEPTEGLDADTARELLRGVRAHNPERSVVIALHGRQFSGFPIAKTAHVELRAREILETGVLAGSGIHRLGEARIS
jgi:ATP-binding cassette subfamily C protein CydC